MKLSVILSCLLLVCVQSKRIRESIYEPLQGISFCFKRANGTHEMGCSSELDGNVGVVHLITNDLDTKWLIENGPHDPYIAVITPKMFTQKVLLELRESGKVNGVVLLGFNVTDPDLTPPDHHSDDNVCPNNPSSLYAPSESGFCSSEKEPWNPYGTNILNENWPFPIFMVDNYVTVNFLRHECFEKFNKPDNATGESRDWPLCAIELQAHMHLAVDTPTCLRRTDLMNPFSPTMVCDKLGDQNVFMLLSPPKETSKKSYGNKSVIVLAAKLDGVNLFENAEMGAESPSTGIVTLLSTAEILSRTLKSSDYASDIENVLFAFFNGEAFDYIGSSRMMYDVSGEAFPAKIEQDESKNEGQWPLVKNSSLKMVLEVGQVYNREGLTAHVDTEMNNRPLVQSLIETANKFSVNLKASDAKEKGLPPSSLQAILKEKRDIDGIVISNFDRSFSGHYYHSIYDNYTRLDYIYENGEGQKIVTDLANLAATLAAYVYEQATGRPVDKISDFTANSTLINEMLNCYMVTARCKLFVEAGTPDTPPQNGVTPTALPYPQYVGVDRKLTYHGIMTHRVLAYLTGSKVDGDLDFESCKTPKNQSIYSYYYFKGHTASNESCVTDKNCSGVCTRTTAWLAEAVSPAFLIKDYDFKSPRYSAWTESVWKTITGRIFLKASPTLDRGFFALGMIVFIVSFLVVFWIERHANVIFGGIPTTSASDERGLVEPTPL